MRFISGGGRWGFERMIFKKLDMLISNQYSNQYHINIISISYQYHINIISISIGSQAVKPAYSEHWSACLCCWSSQVGSDSGSPWCSCVHFNAKSMRIYRGKLWTNHRKIVVSWWFNGSLWDYIPVIFHLALEKHHLEWENPLFRLGHFQYIWRENPQYARNILPSSQIFPFLTILSHIVWYSPIPYQ